MKRLLPILLSALLISTMVGCNSSTPPDSSNPTGSVSDLPSHPDNSIANETSQEINGETADSQNPLDHQQAEQHSDIEMKEWEFQIALLSDDGQVDQYATGTMWIPSSWNNVFESEFDAGIGPLNDSQRDWETGIRINFSGQVHDPSNPFREIVYDEAVFTIDKEIGARQFRLFISPWDSYTADWEEKRDMYQYSYICVHEGVLYSFMFSAHGSENQESMALFEDILKSLVI